MSLILSLIGNAASYSKWQHPGHGQTSNVAPFHGCWNRARPLWLSSHDPEHLRTWSQDNAWPEHIFTTRICSQMMGLNFVSEFIPGVQLSCSQLHGQIHQKINCCHYHSNTHRHQIAPIKRQLFAQFILWIMLSKGIPVHLSRRNRSRGWIRFTQQ